MYAERDDYSIRGMLYSVIVINNTRRTGTYLDMLVNVSSRYSWASMSSFQLQTKSMHVSMCICTQVRFFSCHFPKSCNNCLPGVCVVSGDVSPLGMTYSIKEVVNARIQTLLLHKRLKCHWILLSSGIL